MNIITKLVQQIPFLKKKKKTKKIIEKKANLFDFQFNCTVSKESDIQQIRTTLLQNPWIITSPAPSIAILKEQGSSLMQVTIRFKSISEKEGKYVKEVIISRQKENIQE